MNASQTREPSARALGAALVFAMVFPPVVAWLYAFSLSGPDNTANPLQQATYAGGKVVQFTFPLIFLWLTTRRLPRPERPTWGGLRLGLAFGLLVAAVIVGVYFGYLRHSRYLAATPGQLAQKLDQFGITTPLRYLALTSFLALAHSLLEEYYWRWFVFGGLRRFFPFWPAMIIASLAFASHHVVVLSVYLPIPLVVLASLGVAVGGGFWAWLYEKSGTLYSPWISHLLIDSAIFVVGWDMLSRYLQ